MKKIVSMFVLSLFLIAGSAQADENALTCQAQERLSSLNDENLIQWKYAERYKSAAEVEDRLFEIGYNSEYFSLRSARVGNCYTEVHVDGVALAIQSGESYSILEREDFNMEIRSLKKAERKANTEEEKANASSKLKEARQENVQKIQKIIDGLRASLSNCEC